MELMTLRESLEQTIIQLTRAIDYWSEMTTKGVPGGHHYIHLVRTMEDLKTYIISSERYNNEELRLSSRTNGGLHKGSDAILARESREETESTRNQFVKSNS